MGWNNLVMVTGMMSPAGGPSASDDAAGRSITNVQLLDLGWNIYIGMYGIPMPKPLLVTLLMDTKKDPVRLILRDLW